MIRSRILVLMASASLALAGVSAAPAGAKSSHWSQSKCVKTFNSWYSKRVNLKHPDKKLQQQTNAYIKVLHKHHGCNFHG